MTKIIYHLSIMREFDNLQEANRYRIKKELRGYKITYHIPQPIIPTWVIKTLKFFNLYK